MIEPTETEPMENIDEFIETFRAMVKEAEKPGSAPQCACNPQGPAYG